MKLRLLLDECVECELVAEIKKHRAVNAVWLNDTPLPGSTDQALVEFARKTNRIIVTTETRLNERAFKICTHPGIVVFQATKRHTSVKARMFNALMASGVRARCKHAVTYLRLGENESHSLAVFKERDTRGDVRKTIVDLDQTTPSQIGFQKAKCK